MAAKRIYRMSEYILKHKSTKKYYAGGSYHSPHLTSNTDKAIVKVGRILADMGYDWRRDWDAIETKD